MNYLSRLSIILTCLMFSQSNCSLNEFTLNEGVTDAVLMGCKCVVSIIKKNFAKGSSASIVTANFKSHSTNSSIYAPDAIIKMTMHKALWPIMVKQAFNVPEQKNKFLRQFFRKNKVKFCLIKKKKVNIIGTINLIIILYYVCAGALV